MAWSNPHTIDTYDHSLDQMAGWAEVAGFQREIAAPRDQHEPTHLEPVEFLPGHLSRQLKRFPTMIHSKMV